MKTLVYLSCLVIWASFGILPVSASDWDGEVSLWGGAQDAPGVECRRLYRVRLKAGWNRQWSPAWTSSIAVLGTRTSAVDPYGPPSSADGEENFFDAEGERLSDDGRTLDSWRLQNACVEYKSGRWQGLVGRAPLIWGESHVVRPTAVFHRPDFLEAFDDAPLGSDGADVSYALLSNTSLEGAVRVMRGGETEFVVRVENCGIGVSGTPLFVKREGEDGIGVECSVVLKHLQCRFEGVAWHQDGRSGRRVEFVAGVASAQWEFPFGVEFVRDHTGRLLGEGSDRPGQAADYFSLFIETPATYRLRVSPTVLKSPQGGGWYLRPGITYDVSRHLRLGLDGRWGFGSSRGPLSAAPRLWGLSVTATF